MESVDKAMHKAHAALRCHAKSKRSGLQCKGPAVRGKSVCRMHGAAGGAPKGAAHGMYRHGRRTREAEASRLLIRELLRSARSTLGLVCD